MANIIYKAKTEKQTNRFRVAFYYPVVEYYCRSLGSQILYINTPQKTRSKARTIAKNYIKNCQK